MKNLLHFLEQHIFSEDQEKKLGRIFTWLALGGFFAHLLLIYLANNNTVDITLLKGLNKNYLNAVYTPFSFILYYEVLLLILSLPRSISSFVGVQYEIISLITLRNVFKDLAGASDVTFSASDEALRLIITDMASGILMFLLVGVFYAISKKLKSNKEMSTNKIELNTFINSKMILSVFLAAIFLGLSFMSFFSWCVDVYAVAFEGANSSTNYKTLFYIDLFGIMIFTDVVILLVSMLHNSSYHLVMRNIGFVVSTVLIRISFSLESPYNNMVALSAFLCGCAVMGISYLFVRSDLTE